MIVYRVEHKDSGLGPYRHSGPERVYVNTLLYAKFLAIEDDHLLPHEDGLDPAYLYRLDWKCGFSSKRTLNKWFGPVLDDLFALNYRIVIYKVSHRRVKRGQAQVIFNPHYAHPIEIITERNAIKL